MNGKVAIPKMYITFKGIKNAPTQKGDWKSIYSYSIFSVSSSYAGRIIPVKFWAIGKIPQYVIFRFKMLYFVANKFTIKK